MGGGGEGLAVDVSASSSLAVRRGIEADLSLVRRALHPKGSLFTPS